MAKNKVVNKTRRANNEGSIYRRKDGRWAGYLSVGFDKEGKPIRKTIYGKNQAEVAKKLSDLSGRIKSNSYEIMENHTFGELMEQFLLVFKKPSVSARTFEGNMRNFRLHIEPHIGNMKVYEVDTFVIQKLVNKLGEEGLSIDVIKKNKHLINQFFEYAKGNKWVVDNPTSKLKIRSKDRTKTEAKERYKALNPEERAIFLEALNRDESNFIKPLCILLMFAGLRIGEACALKWKDVNFENKTLKVERGITQVAKFDEKGKVIERVTVVGDTKTACSVREIPITDIVVETLKTWRKKQDFRQKKDTSIKVNLIDSDAFIFANDDGSVRTYSGCRKIFGRFIERNRLQKYNIHFHGLRHTFSNMLFEMNENPKVIQQLLGHRDVKTTITVYNSVDSEYVRQATDKLNDKIKNEEIFAQNKHNEVEKQEQKKSVLAEMSDEEFDDMFFDLLEERKRRKQKQDDMEM